MDADMPIEEVRQQINTLSMRDCFTYALGYAIENQNDERAFEFLDFARENKMILLAHEPSILVLCREEKYDIIEDMINSHVQIFVDPNVNQIELTGLPEASCVSQAERA